MRNFKFIGGPWDGEYHEVSSECVKQGYLDMAQPVCPKLSMGEELDHISPVKHVTYTLRHFAGPIGNIYYFADSDWSDSDIVSQLFHHYLGKP